MPHRQEGRAYVADPSFDVHINKMAQAFYDESDNDFSEDENDDIGSGSDIDFDSDFEAIKVESDANLDETLPQLVESCVPHVPLIGSSSTKSAHQIPGICLFLIFNFIYIGLIII